MCFFFFKQKTAYEMRISDWSSDVCSSDLGARQAQRVGQGGVHAAARCRSPSAAAAGECAVQPLGAGARHRGARSIARLVARGRGSGAPIAAPRLNSRIEGGNVMKTRIMLSIGASALLRSEEHTPELQSLMR